MQATEAAPYTPRANRVTFHVRVYRLRGPEVNGAEGGTLLGRRLVRPVSPENALAPIRGRVAPRVDPATDTMPPPPRHAEHKGRPELWERARRHWYEVYCGEPAPELGFNRAFIRARKAYYAERGVVLRNT